MTATPAPPAGAPAGLTALLDRLEGLRASATPGEWATGQIKHLDESDDWDSAPISTGIYGSGQQIAALYGYRLQATAEYIAELHNALPALLTAARRGAETP